MNNKKLQNFYKSIKNKKIGVVGIGVSNTPLITMLAKAGAFVSAYDKAESDSFGDLLGELQAHGVTLYTGADYLSELKDDIIIKTPGMRYDNPYLLKAQKNGSVITSEMELFFELCPCPIIAVTGSDGKSTTTSLIYEMLKQQGKKVHIGGNIGLPLLCRIDRIEQQDIVVAELSSFQLHTMRKSPSIAVITNLSPNHLDIHKSMEEYVEAKVNIFRYQKAQDLLVVNEDNKITREFISKAKGRVRTFSYKNRPSANGAFYEDGYICYKKDGQIQKLIPRQNLLLRGEYNVENFLAAITAIWDLCTVFDMECVAKGFGGVHHRNEFVRALKGVSFYNDSIASSPTRSIASVRSFDQKVIMISGGYDKNLPFNELGDEICERVKALFLTGSTAQKIKQAVISSNGYDPDTLPIFIIDSFDEAVLNAARYAFKCSKEQEQFVLLSPACASFDNFKNFEERGERFVSLINNLV